MPSGPISDDERAAIIATLIETENVHETARRHDRGIATVSRIAKAEGIQVAARSRTRNATQARQIDAKAARAELRLQLLDDARRLRQQLWEPAVERKAMTVSKGGGVSAVEIVDVRLDQPTFADKQRIMTSAAIAIDKSLALERHDDSGDGELADVDAWAKGMLDADDSEPDAVAA